MANEEGTTQRSKGLFFLERYEEGRSGAPGFQMQSTYIRGLSCSTGLGGKMIVEGLRWAMAPWSLLRSLCTLFFLGIQGPGVPEMMFDILKSCHGKGAGGGVPPITCNNHRPVQGAGAHPKHRSCNAL